MKHVRTDMIHSLKLDQCCQIGGRDFSTAAARRDNLSGSATTAAEPPRSLRALHAESSVY